MQQEFQNPQEAREYMDSMGKEYRIGCYSKQKADGKTIKPHVNMRLLEIIFDSFRLSQAGRIFGGRQRRLH